MLGICNSKKFLKYGEYALWKEEMNAYQERRKTTNLNRTLILLR
jgi:hypothetical protein